MRAIRPIRKRHFHRNHAELREHLQRRAVDVRCWVFFHPAGEVAHAQAFHARACIKVQPAAQPWYRLTQDTPAFFRWMTQDRIPGKGRAHDWRVAQFEAAVFELRAESSNAIATKGPER